MVEPFTHDLGHGMRLQPVVTVAENETLIAGFRFRHCCIGGDSDEWIAVTDPGELDAPLVPLDSDGLPVEIRCSVCGQRGPGVGQREAGPWNS